MEISKAITLTIGDQSEPVISTYKIAMIVFCLYREGAYKSYKITNTKTINPGRSELSYHLNKLISAGVLATKPGIPRSVYSLLGRPLESVEDVVCTIDPFSYVSHLSAMDYHGLTDRIPTKIYVSSPSSKTWSCYAEEKMRKDLGDSYTEYILNSMPKLVRTKMNKILRKDVHRFSSLHLGAYQNVRGRPLRVSTIGRTFLDMLKNPELCGGINHVLSVYEKNAKKFIKPILEEINRNGSHIDKVRAGYILNERLDVDNEIISSWLKFVARGGSRKLDQDADYIPVWSDKWCISINTLEQSNG